jgi:hypothetical protein
MQRKKEDERRDGGKAMKRKKKRGKMVPVGYITHAVLCDALCWVLL